MISEILIQTFRISSPSRTFDKSEILALIAYLQFSIGQIHFTEFALFIFYGICNEQNSVSGCAYGK
jgi:hypothetical protein